MQLYWCMLLLLWAEGPNPVYWENTAGGELQEVT